MESSDEKIHWLCLENQKKFDIAEFYKISCKEESSLKSCVKNEGNKVKFETKGPKCLFLNSDQLTRGCSLIELILENQSNVHLMCFKNFYTASVSVFALDSVKHAWKLIEELTLMPDAHFEKGSRQDFKVHFKNSESILKIRILLRQPSSVWKNFFIENLQVYEKSKESGKSNNDEAQYLNSHITRTWNALKMNHTSTDLRTNQSKILFNTGTHGYEIDKLTRM